MLNSTGTRKVTATDALVRERPISMPPSPLAAAPVDEFELLLSAPGTIKVSATSDKMQELDVIKILILDTKCCRRYYA